MVSNTQVRVPILRADYNAPGATKEFKFPQGKLLTQSTPGQTTAHIAALRSSVLQLQAEINTFLTQKMEEEKADASANGNGTSKKIDEQKEEEHYGEEVEEE